MKEFYNGQKVRWNDPADETSGEYEVFGYNPADFSDYTEADVIGFDERIIKIRDGFSEAEVYAQE